MTLYLTVDEIEEMYQSIMNQSGGLIGIRDRGLLKSAVAQPQMTFGGAELYPELTEKAAALGFALIKNHAFLDGNKRIGYAAIRVFLELNDLRITATVDDREALVLGVAAGDISRDELASWLAAHTIAR